MLVKIQNSKLKNQNYNLKFKSFNYYNTIISQIKMGRSALLAGVPLK